MPENPRRGDGSDGSRPAPDAGAGSPVRSDREAGEVRKSFMGHLLELRARILVCLAAILVCTIAAWVWCDDLVALVRHPIDAYNESAPEGRKVRLLAVSLTEPFVFVVTLGLWGGLLAASPVVAWQTWRFVSPGLLVREKSAVLPVFLLGLFFFAGGAAFAYALVLPVAISYLAVFGAGLGVEMRPALGTYFHLFVGLHAAFGVAFETPLVVLGLARLGLVTAKGLARNWRYVTVGAFVVGAVLTPPDVLTQTLLAGALLVLYVLSIFLAAAFGKRPPPDGHADTLAG